MGMIANYQYLNDRNLNDLKNIDKKEEDLIDTIEDLQENEEILLDIDKMWDVLHFVLTGVDSSKPIENAPLSEAIVGVSSIEDVEEFIAYIEKTRVADIVDALNKFDIEKAMENFSMEACKKADLYPNIWDYDDEEEVIELKEEISDYFENIKVFYQQILEANGNVMITIY